MDEIPSEEVLKSFGMESQSWYDNLYLDMNGLIHPCCHDTAPLPEPESEEEMFERMFKLIDRLVQVVRPRQCLVMAIDGVAPRSKMNQQRMRRFRAAEERQESNAIARKNAEILVNEHDLPMPEFKDRWDHNVITPSTAFMERVGEAIEWFILKKLNEDPSWEHLTVVFSDAHVPGEGEHKIMHYIRGLRSQPGYNPNTTHCIYGMDADLICLGLATHELNFGVLRNQLDEEFKQMPDKFLYFNLCKFRLQLAQDFKDIGEFDFERVVDDFVFLCFFVGNDFLPHLPLVSIKTKGIELMLDHYVRKFDDHSYLTKCGEVNFPRLKAFLKAFDKGSFEALVQAYSGKAAAKERAEKNVAERCDKLMEDVDRTLGRLLPDRSNAAIISNAALSLMTRLDKERASFVAGRQSLTFSYADRACRNDYYQCKFGWDPTDAKTFEEKIAQCSREFLRGMQWVMRYYTKGCPSWEWYYPFYYAPLLQDLAKYCTHVDVEMRMSAPLHPVEQLLAVLPRESVGALPEELHEAVLDRKSVLAKFYPETFHVDFTEALFAYQGIPQLPFIRVEKLRKAIKEVIDLEPDTGSSLIFISSRNKVCREMSILLEGANSAAIGTRVVKLCPIAGRIGRSDLEYEQGSLVECPDVGLAKHSPFYGAPVQANNVRVFSYEESAHVAYDERLLKGARNILSTIKPIRSATYNNADRRPNNNYRGGGGGGGDRRASGNKASRREEDTTVEVEEPPTHKGSRPDPVTAPAS